MKSLSFSVITALVVGMSVSAHASPQAFRYNSPERSNTSLLIANNNNSGSFVGVDHPTQGQAKIIEEDGIKYLEIAQNFQTDRGPDLKVILHNSSTVDTKVQEGEYLSLGALRSPKGSQRYQLPNDIDLSQYQSVAIWCEEYNITFGYASLSQ